MRSLKVSIIGTGYVGLVSGAGLAAVGHEVICVDLVQDRISRINRGEAPFFEPGLSELLERTVSTGALRATTDLHDAVSTSEVTLIAVGTPDREEAIDLSYVKTAALEIGAALRVMPDYHVVAVKSTVLPGTTDTLVREALEAASGKEAGRSFGLCMNPEFLREGEAIQDFMDPDRIVIGQWDEKSGQAMAALYQPFQCPLIFTGLRNAEMIKYTSNALLATLISFSNEIARLCEHTPGADVEEVMDGLHLDRRLSPLVDGQRVFPGIVSYLRAGCGYGGSCLPKDVNALRSYARSKSMALPLLEAVTHINKARPGQLAALAEKALGTLTGAQVAVLGLAFKPGTDDLRSSPALEIIRQLQVRGARVRAYDPVIKALDPAETGLTVELGASLEAALTAADAAILVTAWPEFLEGDWAALTAVMRRQVIIDGRNALRRVEFPPSTRYLGIGRDPQQNYPGCGHLKL